MENTNHTTFCKGWGCLYFKFQLFSFKIGGEPWGLKWKSKVQPFSKPRTLGEIGHLGGFGTFPHTKNACLYWIALEWSITLYPISMKLIFFKLFEGVHFTLSPFFHRDIVTSTPNQSCANQVNLVLQSKQAFRTPLKDPGLLRTQIFNTCRNPHFLF